MGSGLEIVQRGIAAPHTLLRSQKWLLRLTPNSRSSSNPREESYSAFAQL
jgi:hypothetical protein